MILKYSSGFHGKPLLVQINMFDNLELVGPAVQQNPFRKCGKLLEIKDKIKDRVRASLLCVIAVLH